jgi:polysaccharide biosynthesis protein PslG
VTGRRRTSITGLAILLGASLLAGCSLTSPIPFSSAVPSPGAESAQTPGVHAAAPGSLLSERAGISAGSAILWEPTESRQKMLQAVADSGARWFEMDIDWNSIQAGGPSSFWWDATDRVVLDARARGLKILGGLAYSPGWARPASCPPNTDKCLPASPEYFADFARAAVQRYGATSTIPSLRGSIQTWQIWNEPNHYPFVQPVVDAQGYTRLLQRAYVEIKKVDPASTVLAGATAPAPDDPSHRDMSPLTFMREIYKFGAKGYFDAFSHHPYSFPCNPLIAASWNAFTQTKYLHDLMVVKGDGAKKVWGTEAGAPTGADIGACTPNNPGRSVSEASQSQFVADYFKGWYQDFGSFTGPLFWFQIRDNGTDRNNSDDNLGLIRRDFSQKPAYRTYQRLVRGG